MLKIAQSVRDMVEGSETAMTALREDYLNLSGYAKAIRPAVEASTKKSVKPGSIVIALSRMKAELKKRPPLIPDVAIDDISAKSGLMEIAFEKTAENVDAVEKLYRRRSLSSSDFFLVSQGVGEIAVIALEKAKEQILGAFRRKPKTVITGLASLTIRYSERYIETPNSLYAILRRFAIRRMNIVEILSTFTEVTLIFRESDLREAFEVLSEMQREKRR